MSDRPRFFDDIAGVAGGAISALAGLREEGEAMLRARMDDLIQRLDLVRREELDAMRELAANARAGQEAAETRSATLEMRLTALEARVTALEAPAPIPTVAADTGTPHAGTPHAGTPHTGTPHAGTPHAGTGVSPAVSPEISAGGGMDMPDGA